MEEKYLFPIMKTKDLVKYLGELHLDFTETDLKTPTHERLKPAVEEILSVLLAYSRDEAKQKAPFSALQLLPYPELHEQSIADIGFLKNTLNLLWQIGFHDCSLRHLVAPDATAVRLLWSSIVNFVLFRETPLSIFQEYNARGEELSEVRTQLEGEISALKTDVERLQGSRAKVFPVIKALEDEIAALSDGTNKLNAESTTLRGEIKQAHEQMSSLQSQITSDKTLLQNSQHERDRLRSQVIQSPEKMKSRLAAMETEITAKQSEVLELSSKLRDLQAQGLVFNKVTGKLGKRLTTMRACEEDKKKGKELHKEIKHKTNEAIAEEERIAELKATIRHLEKQIAATQSKLTTLQKNGEQKRLETQLALDETERKKVELSYSIQQDKAQLKANQAIIQRKEQEVQWLNQEHAREMAALKQRYSQYAQCLRDYHAAMTQVMSTQ